MTVNFTSGLVKIDNTYFNPDKITSIRDQGYGRGLSTITLEHGGQVNGLQISPSTFANAVVKAQQTGQIIDLDA